MTDQEWLTATDPTPMLEVIDRTASDRKLRLFACACCRRVWERLPDERSRNAVVVAERFADYSASLGELSKTRSEAIDAAGGEYRPGDPPAVVHAPVFAADIAWYRSRDGNPWYRNAASAAAAHPGGPSQPERAAQAELLRELFGASPPRPGEPEPAWLTWTVLVMTQGIYDERAFDRLPILADALQDAGCDCDDILSHCRGPGPHVRGCWVVDLVLGKE